MRKWEDREGREVQKDEKDVRGGLQRVRERGGCSQH